VIVVVVAGKTFKFARRDRWFMTLNLGALAGNKKRYPLSKKDGWIDFFCHVCVAEE
jgi:hypothetical protein